MSGDLKLASEQRVLPGPQLPGIVAELNHSERDQEIQRQILWLIVSRAILMLFGFWTVAKDAGPPSAVLRAPVMVLTLARSEAMLGRRIGSTPELAPGKGER